MEPWLRAKPSSRNFMSVFLLKFCKNLGIYSHLMNEEMRSVGIFIYSFTIYLSVWQLFFLSLLNIKR